MLALDAVDAPPDVGYRSATLSGVLHRTDGASFESVLADLLSPGGPVLLDVSRVRVSYPPAVGAVSRALLDAGGWPASALVLLGADFRLSAALRVTGADRDVVVADDIVQGVDRLGARPERVRRRLLLPGRRAVPHAIRTFLDGVAADWNISEALGVVRPIATTLAVNAVRRPQMPNVLTVSLGPEGLRVAVRDFDRHLGRLSRLPPLFHDPGSAGGELSEWGVTPRSDGKIVWALFRTGAPDEITRRPSSTGSPAWSSRTGVGLGNSR